MPPRLWQRQPGEAPADFTAFVTYLRLRGRRSLRAVAAHTGRSLGSLRRLAARFNWRARVDAFEAHRADASQNAVDLLVQAATTRTAADFERLRASEFQLAQHVLHQSKRWLLLASDPRRRNISLQQVCQLIGLATKLGRLAAGMPTEGEPGGRSRPEEAPGYWTGPSAEEALKRIYGAPSSSTPAPSAPGVTDNSPPVGSTSEDAGIPPEDTIPPDPVVEPGIGEGLPAVSMAPVTPGPPPAAAGQPPAESSQFRRRDAWAACSRHERRVASLGSV